MMAIPNWEALFVAALWRPLVLAMVAGAILRLLRIQHPATQHAAWTAVMAGMLLVLPASNWMPHLDLPVLRAPEALPTVPISPNPFLTGIPTGIPMAAPTQEVSSPSLPDPGVESQTPSIPIGIQIYLLGCSALVAYWSIGWVLIQRIRARSHRTGYSLVRFSAEIDAPVTVGLIRRIVLVPVDWRDWPRDMRHAVLLHELAHLRRHDAWTMLLSRFVRCALWFQPLAWVIGNRIAAFAELACDAEALKCLRRPERYAEILLGFVERVSRRRLAHGVAGLAMAGSVGPFSRTALTWRIHHIFAMTTPEPSELRRPALLAAGLTIPALCIAAGVSVGTKPPRAMVPVQQPQAALQVAQQTTRVPDRSPETLLAQAAPTPTPQRPENAATPNDEPLYIEGTVSDSSTSAPIVNAEVLLEPSDGRKRPYKTLTGGDGKYRASGILPEVYRVSIHHSGYPRAYYQQRANRAQGSTVDLQAGKPVRNVNFSLTAYGIITGRVLDENRRPLAGAQLRAMTARYTADGPTPQMVEEPQGAGLSDDRGEFRMNVPAGRFYLRASLGTIMPREQMIAAGLTPPPELPLRAGENYVATFYPGTSDAAAAQPVTVTGGSVQSGINFALRRIPTTSIRGRILNQTGAPNARMSVSYWPTGGSMQPLGTATADAQGRFELNGVIPGRYSLRAEMTASGQAYWTEARVEVTRVERGSDPVVTPDLVLRPPYKITGSVELVDSKETLQNLNIALTPPGSFVFLPYPQGLVKPDGSFELSPANPDLLVVNLNGLPKGHYLKSARMDRVDVLENMVDLRSGPPAGPLRLVVSGKAGAISGTVLNKSKDPIDGAFIVLWPTRPERQIWAYWVRTAASDKDGRFQLDGLAPGDYKLLVWEEVSQNAWRRPEIRQIAEQQAKTITVREGDPLTVELTALPPVR